MRSYIRHPSEIPIQIQCGEDRMLKTPMRNISHGGICCVVDQYCAPGSAVMVTVDVVQSGYSLPGKVMWCRSNDDSYEIGVAFQCNQEALFTVKMVEQVCLIEAYRKQVKRNEGRSLTCEQAAAEWIDRYAGDFAQGASP